MKMKNKNKDDDTEKQSLDCRIAQIVKIHNTDQYIHSSNTS